MSKKHKLPFFKVDYGTRCTNCNKPLKKNVVDRKTTKPKYCYHCFLLLVKKITFLTKPINYGRNSRRSGQPRKIMLKTLIDKSKRRWGK